MSDNVALLLDNGGGVDKGVSSQVGVGHWLVDGGNNWGKLSNTSVVVGIVVVWVEGIVVSWGVKRSAGVSLGLTLDKGVSNNVALLLNNGGGGDKGVSSQVGVGHWLVDGGNNWGELSNTSVVVGIIVVWVVGIVVSWCVQKAGISFSVTLGKSVISQSLDGASLSSDAIMRAVWADLGNSN